MEGAVGAEGTKRGRWPVSRLGAGRHVSINAPVAMVEHADAEVARQRALGNTTYSRSQWFVEAGEQKIKHEVGEQGFKGLCEWDYRED